jgi:hypothetical protein
MALEGLVRWALEADHIKRLSNVLTCRYDSADLDPIVFAHPTIRQVLSATRYRDRLGYNRLCKFYHLSLLKCTPVWAGDR